MALSPISYLFLVKALPLSLFTFKMGILIPNSQEVIKVNEIIYLACGRLFSITVFCYSYYK